jgi:hypothetical protein
MQVHPNRAALRTLASVAGLSGSFAIVWSILAASLLWR